MFYSSVIPFRLLYNSFANCFYHVNTYTLIYYTNYDLTFSRLMTYIYVVPHR